MESLEKLGKEGRDIVTNFKGTITAVCYYWGGNNRIAITPQSQDGKSSKEEWFDESRVEVSVKSE